MNNLQLGKMYLVKEYFWYVFPTKKLAGRVQAGGSSMWSRGSATAHGPGVARRNAKWLSEDYNCNVFVVEPNTCFVLLEMDERFYKLLDCNGNIGWIYCFDFSDYFELVKE